MKKVLSIWSLTMLLVMCVGFTSCSKDDDDGGKGGDTKKFSELLLGKWKYYAYYDGDWCKVDNEYYIQFNSDGSFSPNYKTWELSASNETVGPYGNYYNLALKGHPYEDDAIWSICIVGKSMPNPIDGYDYPDVLSVKIGFRGYAYVRVK